MRARSVKSVVILAVCIACLAGSESCFSGLGGLKAHSTATMFAQELFDENDAVAAALSFLGEEEAGASMPPSWFERELFSLAPYEEVRASASGGTTAFVSAADPEDAFRALKDSLAANGWTRVDGSQDAAGTFAKAQGACTLCSVACYQVAGKTTVVVQCPFASG